MSRSLPGWVLILVSIVLGTLADRPRPNPPLQIGGYSVLAADFHVHSFPFSWATLSPFDTVAEARRQRLDVIAMTPHNHVWVAKAGRWFSKLTKSPDNPIVIVGEEIHAIGYHVLGIGLKNTISWNQSAESAIDEVHRQEGIAIAAHPTARYWPSYDSNVMRKLDAAEVMHPLALTREDLALQLRQFYERRPLTAIGDSDYHGFGPIGLCRTYVFVRERSEQGVMEALRLGHTVVYDRDHVYGDTALIRLAAEDGRLPQLAQSHDHPGLAARISGITGIAGLILLVLRFRT